MHIALVTTSYPDSRSGSEAAGGFVAEFARELAQHVRVSVVAASANASSVHDEDSVRVHRFAVKRWPLSLLSPLNPADWRAIYSTLRDGGKTLQDLVEADRPDYVLALWALPSGHWARNVQKRHGIPYGIWALGSDIWGLGSIPVLRRYLGTVLAQAERRYADGLRLAREVEHLSGMSCDFLPSSRKLVAGEPTEPASSPPYKLAFLGRWHPNKGVDLLLEALQQLTAEDWSRIAEVRLHGGGPMEADVHRSVSELKQRGYPVSAGGYLDVEAAAKFIAWSDYLVLPSRVESIPVIFSDAAQMRRPLVATPVGDLPRLYEEHEFGVLADTVSARALAESLHKALRMPASRFRGQLDAVTEEFDVARAAEKIVGRVREVVS